MTRRKCTRHEELMRLQVERELISIKPVSPQVRELMTFEGFTRWYERMQYLYPTKEDAYEALEAHHLRIFGRRRYSEYTSFRLVYSRKCNKV
jgi:hypothetical protein